MSIDLHNNIKVSRVISPHSPAATGTIAGQVIDTAGFRSTEFVFQTGLQTTTGITVTPIVLSSTQSTTGFTSAADSILLGTEAAAATIMAGAGGANKAAKIGYVGSNRYVRCDLNITKAASGLYSAVCVQSNPIKGPQS